MKKLMIAAAISAASLIASGAHAAVIYDGGGPDQVNGYYADTSYAYTEAAESFTLAAGANTVGDTHWWGGCAVGTCPTGDFTVSFYADAAGSPGGLISSYAVGNANQTATGNLVSGSFTEYAYSTNLIPPSVLAPGTTYWVGISNSTGLGIGGWFWETTSAGAGDGHAQFLTGTGWTAQPDDLAFNLTNGVVAVPEPASLALLGSGLLGFAALRRRKNAG